MVESPLTEEQVNFLETERTKYATEQLHPYQVVEYLTMQIMIFDPNLPEYIKWNADTEVLGTTNVYYIFDEEEKDGHQIASYFKSEDEFVRATERTQELRDYLEENDGPEFVIDPNRYSVIKVTSTWQRKNRKKAV